ncbi:orotate phosphoribosyltransferase [Vibrio gazogenes]|uniref:Orotate phosphoribosyltransferase n=1 Tax=Vibrio gazogenes DSM 21264 = NBRC 103151 TaxID=1123492 RepID=A0A1M5HFQ3_VIBGA|nr:orotate phosphoribosyltransferase [Vibrio gazogenes]USP13591.1 orotate phosphoribosyltransferase [Vibrio gazogenes]SHG14757.1 orotate phosphoribosyltransferase [Vibrio gazogenes DSM 21264] [Vibrio gazogenes DSM 21264 = NBRC 103151]SJN55613.1 Orotate phosphoribosyltransferase [Vibrio gazogenes]
MSNIQSEFAAFLIDSKVINFGEFKLKSGRVSPYFFNFGQLSSARLLNETAHYYARFLYEHKLRPDVIFGPAYKGIPLGVATALSLQRDFAYNVQFSFNRKEVKSYGDGGFLVGSQLQKACVVIIDDVITSGITIDDSVKLVVENGGQVKSYLVALDRQERSFDCGKSAIQDAEERLGLNIFSITNIQHILAHLTTIPNSQSNVESILNYLKKYGV